LSEAVNFSAVLPPTLSLQEAEAWLTSYQHPSIGPALRGNTIHILDENGKECASGKTGEVCIRGWNVMKGYTDSPPGFFSDGYLHTGDLGYFQLSQNGVPFYFISGRIKDVIKRSGETLSLRELDDCVLPLLPEGCDAVSVGFENDIAGEEVGLIVNISKIEDQTTFLQKLAQLPKGLRPSVVLFKSDGLRTASGKPQRWKFKSLFAKYKTQLLGSRLKSENFYE
jgi:long-chain acyl-CoA synthetase